MTLSIPPRSWQMWCDVCVNVTSAGLKPTPEACTEKRWVDSKMKRKMPFIDHHDDIYAQIGGYVSPKHELVCEYCVKVYIMAQMSLFPRIVLHLYIQVWASFRMYFTIKHCIRVPWHVFSMMIAGFLLDKCGWNACKLMLNILFMEPDRMPGEEWEWDRRRIMG